MRRFFDMESPLMEALSTAADLLILNLLTLMLSLPIFTMGAALTAMNDIVIRIVRGEEGYIVKPFFRAFAANLKKGTLLGLLLMAAAGLLYLNYLAALVTLPGFRVVSIAIAVIVLAFAFYAFALMARYENTLRATLKNAAVLAVGYFPRTLFMVVCAIGLWLVCIHFYRVGVPLLMLFGLSLPCYVNCLLLKDVFHRLDSE